MPALRKPDFRKRLAAFHIAAVIAGFLAVHLCFPYPENRGDYTYSRIRAADGIVLHTIRTKPERIGLKAIDRNVTLTADEGINGGFFWEGYLLSIAVINDRPVKGQAGDYGSGWYNTDRPKGTLVWDGAAKRFFIQVTDNAEDLQVTDRSRYWAQGGVSMSLRDDGGWARQAEAEDMPALDEARMRSAIAYDSAGYVWLIVTPAPCTVEQFRSAVKNKVAAGSLVDGLFLDGDGSSQMKTARTVLPGDHREVFQMITLLRGKRP